MPTTPAMAAAEIREYFGELRADRVATANWANGTVDGGPLGTGHYPMTLFNGETVMMPSIARLVADAKPRSPFEYGAVGSPGGWGSQVSRPAKTKFATLGDCQAVYPFATSLEQELDFLGIQAWHDAGGFGLLDRPYQFKMSNENPESWTPLITVAGRAHLIGSGSGLHWQDTGLLTDLTQYVPNHNFATADGWENATQYPSSEILPVTFGGGEAVCFDPDLPATGPGRQGRFYQFGKRVWLSNRYCTAKVRLEAELGQSYALGNNQPAWGGLGFNSNGPGSGGSVIQSKVDIGGQVMSKIFTPGRHLIEASFDFIVPAPGWYWLTFSGGGYVNYYIKEIGINRWLPNTAIMCTRDGDEFRSGAEHHYTIPMGFEGFYMWGKRGEESPAAMRWKSFESIDGNLVAPANIMMDGFGDQVLMGDGAYLLPLRNINGNYGQCGIRFEGGRNSGENNRFYWGGFNNNKIGIANPHTSRITLFGTSLDYNIQSVVDNAGAIAFGDVHIEQKVPEDEDKPLFDLIEAGSIVMHGGEFLGAIPEGKEIFSSPCAPIRTNNSKNTFQMYGTKVYHLGSDPNGAGEGMVMSGPGQIFMNLLTNQGNPNIGPVGLSKARGMDVLAGAGHFEPVPGTPFFAGMGRGESGIDLMGGAYFADADLSDEDEYLDQWETSRITAKVIVAADGKRSLEIEKLSDYGGGRIQIFIPVTPGHWLLGQFRIKLPTITNPDPLHFTDDHATIYNRRFWAKLNGFDLLGRPIVAETWDFSGGDNILLPFDVPASGLYEAYSLATTYKGEGSQDPAKWTASAAPAGATHLALLLDHESAPAMKYELRGLFTNLL